MTYQFMVENGYLLFRKEEIKLVVIVARRRAPVLI